MRARVSEQRDKARNIPQKESNSKRSTSQIDAPSSRRYDATTAFAVDIVCFL